MKAVILLKKNAHRARNIVFPLALSVLATACLGGGGGGTETVSATSPDITSATPSSATPMPAVGASSGGVAVTAPSTNEIAALTDVGVKGKTYYVATNGADSNTGLSLDQPLKTVDEAIRRVGAGDTIELRGGTYTGGQIISKGGTTSARIKIKAYNGEKARIYSGGKDYGFYFLQSAGNWIVEGLEIYGDPAQPINSYVVKIDAPGVRLVKNSIHGAKNDQIKLVSTANDVVIYQNEIHDAQNITTTSSNAQGIDIVGADRVRMAYNYVHNIKSLGMYAKGNARNTVFENNRVVDISDRGIMLGQSTGTQFLTDGRFESYDGIIRNNIVINTDSACLAVASSDNARIYNNSCYNTSRVRLGSIFVSNEAESQQPNRTVYIKNNIVYGGGTRPVVHIAVNAMENNANLFMDRNIYWTPNGAPMFQWDDRNLYGQSLVNWQQQTGKEGASKAVDPRYANLGTLALAAGGPAIDAGEATSLVTIDYLGARRPFGGAIDIGAYEYGSSK